MEFGPPFKTFLRTSPASVAAAPQDLLVVLEGVDDEVYGAVDDDEEVRDGRDDVVPGAPGLPEVLA